MHVLEKIVVGSVLVALFATGAADVQSAEKVYREEDGDGIKLPLVDGWRDGAITLVAMWLLRAVLYDQRQSLEKIAETLEHLAEKSFEGNIQTRQEIIKLEAKLDELAKEVDLVNEIRGKGGGNEKKL